MDHVIKHPNGTYYVEIKVPKHLRKQLGTNLRRTLGSKSLDAQSKRLAHSLIAEFQAKITEAEHAIAQQAEAKRVASAAYEKHHLLAGFGFNAQTDFAEYIDIAASGWPTPDVTDVIYQKALDKLTSAPNQLVLLNNLDSYIQVMSKRLDTARRLLTDAKKLPSPSVAKALDSTLTISRLLEKLKENAPPTDDTFRQYNAAVKLFIESQGDATVSQVNRNSTREFRDYLHGRTDLTYGTCDQRMKKLSALFNFAIRESYYAAANPFTGMKLSEQVKAGHGDPDPGKYLSPDIINVTLTEILPKLAFADFRRWPFLVMLFSGMRAEECCGLRLDEIGDHWGVNCYHIRARKEDNRTVKTGKNRYTPIHSFLWTDLGFSKYVADRRQAGQVMLFDLPQWRGRDYAGKYQEEMGKLRHPIEEARGIDLGDQHDLRHTLITLLREANVGDEHRCLIVGQATGSRVNAGYGDQNAILKHLKDALEKIDLSKYDFTAIKPVS